MKIKKLFSPFGKIAIWFDRLCNYTIGKINKVWSEQGGKSNQTISHTLGLEEAKQLWVLYRAFGDAVFDMKDIPIEGEHLLGELSSDICDFFQKWHALRSINWAKDNAKALQQRCVGIKELVERFLDYKGIKD